VSSTPSFNNDVKPLFRELDRQEMDYYIDLWSYEEVKAEAELVLERVQDGTMPCDKPWEPEQVQILRDWISSGCAP
jgi:hypothetical protein